MTEQEYVAFVDMRMQGQGSPERYCLGLLSELGEVAGKIEKCMRGDYDETAMEMKILSELGDVVFWYVALAREFPKKTKPYFDLVENCILLARCAVSLGVLMNGPGGVPDVASIHKGGCGLGTFLVLLIEQQGFTLEQVIENNVTKLTSRAARGKIQGDGDDR